MHSTYADLIETFLDFTAGECDLEHFYNALLRFGIEVTFPDGAEAEQIRAAIEAGLEPTADTEHRGLLSIEKVSKHWVMKLEDSDGFRLLPQLVLFMFGAKGARKCAYAKCGKVFYLQKWSSRETCSDNCRQRKWYHTSKNSYKGKNRRQED